MTRFFYQATAWILSVALLCSTALASYALGDELSQTTVPLAAGASLTTQQFWSNSKSDFRTENYITYTPGAGLIPAVSYGNSVLAMNTVSSMAKALEKSGKRVLSGMNGDYFVMATGDPLGMVITDGILRSSASHLSAIGFLQDGTALIGKPQLSVTANFSGYALKVGEVNKIRTAAGGYYLLTEDFGTTTKNTQPGVDVILTPQTEHLGETVATETGTLTRSNQLKIGGRVSCVVEQVVQNVQNLPIPAGKFVLTINKKGNEWLVSELAALTPGSTVELDISTPDTRWNNAICAVGAMHHIVTNGVVSNGLEAGAAPRTAVGIKADGTTIFYTIDGRQEGVSIGATLTQVATRLLELGCVEAVALDGGGSTTLGVTMPDSNGFTVSNSPSGGTQRAVSNALFLVSTLAPTGTPGSLYVKAPQTTVLIGGTLPCSASFLDSGWYPMNSSDPITWTAKNGTISATGQYIAPTYACTDQITATSGTVSGTMSVKVYDTPDCVRILNEATGLSLAGIQLDAGQSINLTATAAYRTIPLPAQDTSFQWSVTPGVGTVTSDGTLTAGSATASGKLTITVGQHTASIPVTVAAESHFLPVADFEETTLNGFHNTEGFSAVLDTTQVRYGKQSVRLDFDSLLHELTLNADLPLQANGTQLSAWVYGDGSGHLLSLTCQDAGGASHRVPLTYLSFQGWKQVWTTLPAQPTRLTEFTIAGTGVLKGSIWMDQLTLSNQTIPDDIAPVISLSVSGTQVSATISDNNKTPLEEKQISLTLDGAPLPFTWNAASNTLNASLPAYSNVAHQLTIKAVDVSGNIGSASYLLNASGAGSEPFSDLHGHWAAPYVACLHEMGIINGMQSGNTLQFLPTQSITRGDFALMIARGMGLELERFSDISLPFADTTDIPAWSLNAVKAMYNLGIMQGSQVGGNLCANATAPISRAETMTLLGRIQPKGYPVADLSAYQDATQVPAWAAPYVQSLVGQGIVKGDQGRLRTNVSISRAEVAKLLFSIR